MKYDEVVSELRRASRPVEIEWCRKFYRPTKLVPLSSIRNVVSVSEEKKTSNKAETTISPTKKASISPSSDTIFHPPSPIKGKAQEEEKEHDQGEWIRHVVSTLPLEQLNLESESVRAALSDLPQADALKEWLSTVLSDDKNQNSLLPQNLQRGLEFENISSTSRDTLLLLIVPMLQRLHGVNLKIWKRSRIEVKCDLRLRLEHARLLGNNKVDTEDEGR